MRATARPVSIVMPNGGEGNPRVVGILTSRDLKFVEDGHIVSDVMTKDDLVSAPPETELEEARNILRRAKVEKLLLMDGEGLLHGLITIRDLDNLSRFPDANLDPKGRLFVAAAAESQFGSAVKADGVMLFEQSAGFAWTYQLLLGRGCIESSFGLKVDAQGIPTLAHACGDLSLLTPIGEYPADWQERCAAVAATLCDAAQVPDDGLGD